MPARPDGTEPLITHGSVYLRAAERDDIPRFVPWFNDDRTTRGLGFRAPMSIPMEEAWLERMVADQGKTGYRFTVCLIADDGPIGSVSLFDLDLVNGSAGLGIRDRRAGRQGSRPWDGHARGDRGLRFRKPAPRAHLGSTLTTSTRGLAVFTSGWAQARRGPAARDLPRGQVLRRPPDGDPIGRVVGTASADRGHERRQRASGLTSRGAEEEWRKRTRRPMPLGPRVRYGRGLGRSAETPTGRPFISWAADTGRALYAATAGDPRVHPWDGRLLLWELPGPCDRPRCTPNTYLTSVWTKRRPVGSNPAGPTRQQARNGLRARFFVPELAGQTGSFAARATPTAT